MNWVTCGTYLDRLVCVTGLLSLEEFCTDANLSSSLLLTCFEDRNTCDEEFLTFLDKVVPLCPLSLSVSGVFAASYFDSMIVYLDKINVKCQIMTRFNDSTELECWLMELFQATWPAEENFNLWSRYSIVVVGSKVFQEQMFSTTARFMDVKEGCK